MKTSWPRTAAKLLITAIFWCGWVPCATAQAAPPAGAISFDLTPWQARLTSLHPSRPEGYLLLGEELADATEPPECRRLAEHVLCLAFELSRHNPQHLRTAGSAATALAALAIIERDRRWLLAISEIADPARATPLWNTGAPPESVDAGSYRVAEFLGLVRSGEGPRARMMLGRSDTRQRLEGMDHLLRRSGVPGGLTGLEREAGRWPCLTCGGKRVVRRVGGGVADMRPCSNCEGKSGAMLSPADLTAQLRLESWLLQPTQRSWAAQITADGGAPLIDPDPASVCAHYKVDPALCLWRDGEWVGQDGLPPAHTLDPSPADADAEPDANEHAPPPRPAGVPPGPNTPPHPRTRRCGAGR
jgi:hypothetical protein